MDDYTFLIADIGGTKSDLALFKGSDITNPVAQHRYINTEYAGADEILKEFQATVGELPRVACFAVAGLIGEEIATMTNLPWSLSAVELKSAFSFTKVLLINDLTAVASSISYLDAENEKELLTIYPGSSQGGEVAGVIAPGTGLGEGLVVNTSQGRFVTGSEGGHTGFAPLDEEQIALLRWAQQKHNPVTYETLIAGPGFARLYDFCREHHSLEESAAVKEAMLGVKDRTPAIIQGATADDPCPLCQKVIDLFLGILGSEAGNLALKLYAKGGIYLGGGILPRLLDDISFDSFLGNYLNKGDMASLVAEIPVRLIVHKNAPLLGAAGYLLESMTAES